jgi:metal-responsive CopG/Arc/MetJ family transcriptional regulator
MPDYSLPVSVSITQQQLDWLDERRRHGSLSRSAALRQVLDAAMERELLLATPDRAAPDHAATSTASR